MKFTKIGPEAGLLRLACEGEISTLTLEPGADPLKPLLDTAAPGDRVLIDLERATFIDSSGISWLITVHQAVAAHGGLLVLHSIPPLIQNMLKLMRLELVLHLAADEAAARKLTPGAQP